MGLSFFRARFLDHSTGRFLSEDAFGSMDYGYASSNPLSMKDPTGHFSIVAYVALATAVTSAVLTTLSVYDGYDDFMTNLKAYQDCDSRIILSHRNSPRNSETWKSFWRQKAKCRKIWNRLWAETMYDVATSWSFTRNWKRLILAFTWDQTGGSYLDSEP